jgi:hypothetical protein
VHPTFYFFFWNILKCSMLCVQFYLFFFKKYLLATYGVFIETGGACIQKKKKFDQILMISILSDH